MVRVVVPSSTSLEAGRILIDTLGEQEVVDVIGGKEWWQRTAHKTGGVDGEWISMKRDWQGLDAEGDDNEQLERLRDEKLQKMKQKAKADQKRRWKMGKEKEDSAETTPEGTGPPTPEPEILEEASYSSEMDEMRCVIALSTPGLSMADGDLLSGADVFCTSMAEPTSSVASTLIGECIVISRRVIGLTLDAHRYSIWRYARKIGGRAFCEQIHTRFEASR